LSEAVKPNPALEVSIDLHKQLHHKGKKGMNGTPKRENED
jgi:hypothetical protein